MSRVEHTGVARMPSTFQTIGTASYKAFNESTGELRLLCWNGRFNTRRYNKSRAGAIYVGGSKPTGAAMRFHPSLPDEPLIFIEVALAAAMSAKVQALLDPESSVVDPAAARCAVFYSITNCQEGLRGVCHSATFSSSG